MHEDRHRANSFGEDAEQYDRARPSYPEALIDDLTAGVACRVLDVGCGTGIVARLFIGCPVIGVEADPRMAEVAGRHGIDVDIASFESWVVRGAPFDLVVSGQAWHWVDPAVGPAKAYEVLRVGGRFAAFWNEYQHDDRVRAALDAVYRRCAPALAGNSVSLGLRPTGGSYDVALAAAGFVDIEWRTYTWRRDYTAEGWVDELQTHSDHRTMDPSVRAGLLPAVLDAVSDGFTVTMHTRVLTARRMT